MNATGTVVTLALVGSAALVGCGTATNPAPTPTPSPAPSASPSALASVRPPVAVGACGTPQLEMVIRSITGAAGHATAEVAVRNRGTADCTLQGSVGLQMLDPGGHALPTNLVRDAGERPIVSLPAGSGPLSGANSVGQALLELQWVSNCEVTGVHQQPIVPASLAIIPPDQADPLTIPARSQDGRTITVCPGQAPAGTIHTHPIVPAAHE
ncbi:MAG: DUF4232 domain-containing protein [Candidatus Dormibacteraeota bacterium]|nr:DUF4232 domain-containing protein [Candidatus Dormibacteraeota bacterium]